MFSKPRANLLITVVLLAVLVCTTFTLWAAAYASPTEAPMPMALKLTILAILAPLLVKLAIQAIGLVGYNFAKFPSFDPYYPSVSVLVPAFNEEVGIAKTLASIAASNYPNLQIVVVDDGSSDTTDGVIKHWMRSGQFNRDRVKVCHISLPNGGKASALNQALNWATGEVVVTIDADSLVAPQSIFEIVQPFKDNRVGAVAGNIVVHASRSLVTWVQQLEYLIGFIIKRADSFYNSVYIIGGAAAAYRRTALDKVGHFDDKLITEDIDLSVRMLKAGFKTKFAAKACVITEAPEKLNCLVKQRLRWKYGRLQTLYKHRELFLSRTHNPYFSFLQLPMSLYAELMLALQWPLLIITLFITLSSLGLLHLAITSGVLALIVGSLALIDRNRSRHRNLLLLAPASWLAMPVIDMAETLALAKTIKRAAFRQGVSWQSWSRTGIK